MSYKAAGGKSARPKKLPPNDDELRSSVPSGDSQDHVIQDPGLKVEWEEWDPDLAAPPESSAVGKGVNRRRIGNNRIVEIDRAKLRKLITFAKSAGLKPDARRWLVRDTIAHARTIIDCNRLELDPHSIRRTLKAAKKLAQELASPSYDVQQLYLYT